MNRKVGGRTALHYAAVTSNVALVKLLLEFGANTEIEVSTLLCSCCSTFMDAWIFTGCQALQSTALLRFGVSELVCVLSLIARVFPALEGTWEQK